MTIDDLREFGADVDDGLKRCINNEAFYLEMVSKAAKDRSTLERLEKAVAAGDLDDAFEAAHALKGVLANLALVPVLEPVSEMVELLRSRTETDYSGYIVKVRSGMDELGRLVG